MAAGHWGTASVAFSSAKIPTATTVTQVTVTRTTWPLTGISHSSHPQTKRADSPGEQVLRGGGDREVSGTHHPFEYFICQVARGRMEIKQ